MIGVGAYTYLLPGIKEGFRGLSKMSIELYPQGRTQPVEAVVRRGRAGLGATAAATAKKAAPKRRRKRN